MLNHRNIITAHDADRVGNTHFLVMEFVDGCDLNRWLRTMGPLPVSAAAEFIMQTAEGLRHADRRHLVHRDIKPVNLLLTWDHEEDQPVVKILDMGLARFISETQEDGGITRVGQLIGTPDYIAPEAAKNFTEADIRADIFSLGCAFFRLLTGRLPFAGNNAMEKLMARATEDAPDVSSLRPEVPAELAAIVAKMLARNPDDRYQSPKELIAALKPYAATKLGDQATLDLFRHAPAATADDSDAEGDADTSFEEFYQDFSVSPKSDGPSAPDAAPRISEANESKSVSLLPYAGDENEDNFQKKYALVRPEKQAGLALDDDSSVDVELPLGTQILDDDEDGDDAMLSSAAAETDVISPLTRRRSGWDSPLMLVGGGLLVLLVVAGAFLVWQLNRESGDALLRQAEDDYEASSYGQAIDKYNHYLERFPDHKDVSLARVHRGLAQIRQAEQGGNWQRALEVTNQSLDEIRSEDAFGESRNELAAVLPKISAGLAEQAHASPSAELIASAREALALVEKYVVKSLRPTEELEESNALLARAERDLGRDDALAATVKSIGEAVAQGDSNAAYAARRELLRDYPDLQDNAELAESVLAISSSMKDAVTVSDDSRDATTDEPPPEFAAKLVLTAVDASSRQLKVDSAVTAVVRGSLFGIDGATGRTLWHRFIGTGTTTPTTVADPATGDVLVVDMHAGQLLRLDGSTGALRWSQPLSTTAPAEDGDATTRTPAETAVSVGGKRAVATDSSGLVRRYDVESGKLLQTVTLPQALRLAASSSVDGATTYVVADHSNLFVIDTASGDCRQVFYLGHEPGTIRIPPLVVGRYVVIAENHRLDDARLRILLASEDGSSVSEIQRVDLAGHVTTPPALNGATMFAVTDLNGINVFEIQPPGNDTPFAKVLSRPPSSTEHMLRFAAIADDQLLVADDQLTYYDVRATGGRMPPKAVFFDNQRFLQAPRIDHGVMFLVHQQVGRPEVTVSAVRARDAENGWTGHVAAPVVGGLIATADRDALLAATSAGDLFDVSLEGAAPHGDVAAPIVQLPATSGAQLSTSAQSVRVDAQRVVLGDSTKHDRLLLCELGGMTPALRWLMLPAPLGGPPCELDGGIVAAGLVGQVFLLDAESASALATPFQTTLATGLEHHWYVAPLADDPGAAAQAVLVAGIRPTLFRLGVERGNPPALVAKGEGRIAAPITRGFATVGSSAFAVDENNQLVVIDSATLDVTTTHALSTPCAWGPATVGDFVLLATDDGDVSAFSADGSAAWTTTAFAEEQVIGAARREDGKLALATTQGRVVLVAPENGEAVDQLNLRRPLSSGPVLWKQSTLVTSPDGVIYAVDLR
ncbi:MAG: PQQ-binding-like beta-propeller repeat protein [Pirellulales bacterium]